jgi:hypothetical protein
MQSNRKIPYDHTMSGIITNPNPSDRVPWGEMISGQWKCDKNSRKAPAPHTKEQARDQEAQNFIIRFLAGVRSTEPFWKELNISTSGYQKYF